MFVLLYKYIRQRSISIRFIRYGIFLLMSVFIVTSYFSFSIQYDTWKSSVPGKYLLPPYQPIDYFYSYSAYHFIFPYILDVAISFAWVFYLILLAKYSNKRFLDEKEIHLGFFTALVAGWPNFIFYIFILFGLIVLKQVFNYFILKKRELIPIAPYMMLASLIVMILSLYFLDRLGLDKLKLVA